MENDKIFDSIQKAFEHLDGNFTILEEQIEIETQKEYFKLASELRASDGMAELQDQAEELFAGSLDVNDQKKVLCALAGVNDVKIYRGIERFVNECEEEVKPWGILALQESRMLLQSSLLGEQQVFISTGLGGKRKMLRYFVVFLQRNREGLLTAIQQKLLRDELIFELKKQKGELETIDFIEGFSTCLVVLPIQIDIRNLFNRVVEECNQYGGFLEEDLLITNMKVLSRGEIIQLIDQKKENTPNGLEE